MVLPVWLMPGLRGRLRPDPRAGPGAGVPRVERELVVPDAHRARAREASYCLRERAFVEVLGDHHAILRQQVLGLLEQRLVEGARRRADRGRRRRSGPPCRQARPGRRASPGGTTWTSPPAPASARTFSRMASMAARLWSTSTTRAAPRESASRPTPPLPANASRKRHPGRRGARMSNRVCRTRAPGRARGLARAACAAAGPSPPRR